KKNCASPVRTLNVAKSGQKAMCELLFCVVGTIVIRGVGEVDLIQQCRTLLANAVSVPGVDLVGDDRESVVPDPLAGARDRARKRISPTAELGYQWLWGLDSLEHAA